MSAIASWLRRAPGVRGARAPASSRGRARREPETFRSPPHDPSPQPPPFPANRDVATKPLPQPPPLRGEGNTRPFRHLSLEGVGGGAKSLCPGSLLADRRPPGDGPGAGLQQPKLVRQILGQVRAREEQQ